MRKRPKTRLSRSQSVVPEEEAVVAAALLPLRPTSLNKSLLSALLVVVVGVGVVGAVEAVGVVEAVVRAFSLLRLGHRWRQPKRPHKLLRLVVGAVVVVPATS
jgi:hypothetical protein